MNTNQKDVSRSFWLWWVLASAIGFGVGAVLAAFVSETLSPQNVFGWGVSFGILFGSVGGIAQWLDLRRWFTGVGLWAPATALGFMIAAGIAVSMDQQVASNSTTSAILFAVVFGVTGGRMQWLVLRKHGVTIGWWLAASALGSLLGITVGIPLIIAPWSIITLFGFGAVFGVGLGITTGGALNWLLRHPKSESRAGAATQDAS